MELAFESKSLRSICEDSAEAERELGPHVADALRRRLADLRAANSPSELPPAVKPRESPAQEQEIMVLTLTESHVLVFSANHVNNPTNEMGKVDWDRVSRIRIESIQESDD